jgi:hypothetical protein
MLPTLESRLATALSGALPQGVQVETGPQAAPPAEGVERVAVSASRLEVLEPKEPQDAPGREPSHLTQVQRWSADGAARDFTLPESVQGDIVEVESPPGHLARLGEDYQLDGDTVAFFQPPAAGTEVVATVRQGRARGYVERRPCRVRLHVESWAADFARADALLERALAAVLAASLDLGIQEAPGLGSSGVRLRLLEPALALTGLERERQLAGTRAVPHALATLRLDAQLETTVALGAAEPEGRIQDLRYTLVRAR